MPELNSVALLAEGVDRNFKIFFVHTKIKSVALLAEGVDRNSPDPRVAKRLCLSPSSRRAWIEIFVVNAALLVLHRRPPRGGRG